MQENQKHLCRFCNKSFRCGRSLGGHMRSHLINISSSDHQKSDPNKKRTCKALFGHSVIAEQNQTEPGRKNIDHQDQQEVALSLMLLSKKIETESGGPKPSKFRCVICKKGFPSYQALGGHRASHKKFKGCCAPTTDQNPIEPEIKDHECPICFKIFQSGQALGGHKRSHLVADQKRRRFLDLNLPAPVEEDELRPWWIATTLLSSSCS